MKTESPNPTAPPPQKMPNADLAGAPFALRKLEVLPLRSSDDAINDALEPFCELLESIGPTHAIYSGRGEVDHAQLLTCFQLKLIALGASYADTHGVEVNASKPSAVAHTVDPNNPRLWISYPIGSLGYDVSVGDGKGGLSIRFERTGQDT